MWHDKTITSPLPQFLWPDDDLLWRALMMGSMAWLFDHMFLRDQVINETYYISTITIPINTKLGKVVNYCERLPPLKLLDPFVTWATCSHLYLYFHKIYYEADYREELQRANVYVVIDVFLILILKVKSNYNRGLSSFLLLKDFSFKTF